MTAPGLAVGIDVGGTKIAALLVDRAGRARRQGDRATPADDQPATPRPMVDAAKALSSDDVIAVGVAAAGLIDLDGVMRFAPNLAWRDVPLAAHVGRALRLPVVADNDNNAAAWGEYRFGAGRRARSLLLVGVGTGIGGGIVLDGRLYRGAGGFAAEIGHIVVLPDGPECGCGNRGCWEQLGSGSAITRGGVAAAARHPHSLLVRMSGGDPRRSPGRWSPRRRAPATRCPAASWSRWGSGSGSASRPWSTSSIRTWSWSEAGPPGQATCCWHRSATRSTAMWRPGRGVRICRSCLRG